MNPISRRTLLTALSTSVLLPTIGCGGGNKEEPDPDLIVDPPTRGVGSFVWRTRLSLTQTLSEGPGDTYVRRMRHETSDNTLRVITQTTVTRLTEYTLDFDTGRILREQVHDYDSPVAREIRQRILEEAGRYGSWFRKDNPQSLTRLDVTTEQPLWTYTAESGASGNYVPNIRNPILADDGTVYLTVDELSSGIRPRIFALDGATGRLLWKSEWFLNPSNSDGYMVALISLEPALSSEGVFHIEATFKYYPGHNFPAVGKSVTIVNADTGKVVRGVNLFDSRGVWDISIPNPLLSPKGHLIAGFRDSVVAMRIKWPV